MFSLFEKHEQEKILNKLAELPLRRSATPRAFTLEAAFPVLEAKKQEV